jgi:hypothetical protein
MRSQFQTCVRSSIALCHARACSALLACAAVGLTGCGNSLYALRANSASAKLQEARSAGAEQRAPYEYNLANEHLQAAMSEAAEADYGDAYELADEAYNYAELALRHCAGSTAAQAGEAGKKETAR